MKLDIFHLGVCALLVIPGASFADGKGVTPLPGMEATPAGMWPNLPLGTLVNPRTLMPVGTFSPHDETRTRFTSSPNYERPTWDTTRSESQRASSEKWFYFQGADGRHCAEFSEGAPPYRFSCDGTLWTKGSDGYYHGHRQGTYYRWKLNGESTSDMEVEYPSPSMAGSSGRSFDGGSETQSRPVAAPTTGVTFPFTDERGTTRLYWAPGPGLRATFYWNGNSWTAI